MFYLENPAKGDLLKFKQQTLEQHASDLFDMLSAPAKALASFDEQRIRAKLEVRLHQTVYAYSIVFSLVSM